MTTTAQHKDARKTAAAKPPRRQCEQNPVASVAVDISLQHLDRPFDYLVPEALADDAVPGARVRVRFAGRLVDGFVLDRMERSEHGGRLGFLERVVSPEPVLTPDVAALARAVADRYVGSLADVLRLAVPPRHARAEASVPTSSTDGTTDAPDIAGSSPAGSSPAGSSPAGSSPAGSSPAGPVVSPRAGPPIRPAPPSWARSAAAPRPGRSGRPPPARTGRPGWPRPLRPRMQPDAAPYCWYRTPATWPGSRPRWLGPWARTTT